MLWNENDWIRKMKEHLFFYRCYSVDGPTLGDATYINTISAGFRWGGLCNSSEFFVTVALNHSEWSKLLYLQR